MVRIGAGIKPVFGWLGSRCEERAASPPGRCVLGLAALDPSHPGILILASCLTSKYVPIQAEIRSDRQASR